MRRKRARKLEKGKNQNQENHNHKQKKKKKNRTPSNMFSTNKGKQKSKTEDSKKPKISKRRTKEKSNVKKIKNQKRQNIGPKELEKISIKHSDIKAFRTPKKSRSFKEILRTKKKRVFREGAVGKKSPIRIDLSSRKVKSKSPDFVDKIKAWNKVGRAGAGMKYFHYNSLEFMEISFVSFILFQFCQSERV